MDKTLFFVFGIALVVSAVGVALIGLKFENFPSNRGALLGVIMYFAAHFPKKSVGDEVYGYRSHSQLIASPRRPMQIAVILPEGREAITAGSLRVRMEKHRANPNCASCHQRMDPIGFGFENFDAIGQWRTRDGNFDIDSSGVGMAASIG